MQIKDFLAAEHIYICRNVPSKKRLLEFLSEQFSGLTGLEQTVLFHDFITRERLGSTGLGNGFALPHIRSKDLKEPLGIFLALHPGVDFNSPDAKPVDLVFGLIMPDDQTTRHLQTISKIATLFHSEAFRDQIRACKSAREIYRYFIPTEYGSHV